MPFWKKKAAREAEKTSLSEIEALMLRVSACEQAISALAQDYETYKKTLTNQWYDTYEKLRTALGRTSSQMRRLKEAEAAANEQEAMQVQAVQQQQVAYADPTQLSAEERQALRRQIAGM